jgi:isopentenyl-diphosphate delta-isomerase
MIEHEYVHVFEAEVSSDTLFKLNPDEVNAVKWMLPHQAQKEAKQKPQLYTRWFRLYLLKYFAKVFKQKLT